MTAVNIFVQKDKAFLLTDRAQYDSAGVVQSIGTKVVMRPDLRFGVGFSGRASARRLFDALQAMRLASQEHLLKALPALAAKIKSENSARHPEDGLGDVNDVQLFVVMWSLIRRRPEAWFCSTNCAWFGSGYEPGTVRQLSEMITPAIDEDRLFGPCDKSDEQQFPVILAAPRLMYAQRLTPWIDGGEERYFVGGGYDVFIAAEDGISVAPPVHWHDRPGAQIYPNAVTAGVAF